MPAAPGETFGVGYHHVGDRVEWNGRKYRVTGVDPVTRLVWVVSDSHDYQSPSTPIYSGNLTFAWCPRNHGGTGRPRPASREDTRPCPSPSRRPSPSPPAA